MTKTKAALAAGGAAAMLIAALTAFAGSGNGDPAKITLYPDTPKTVALGAEVYAENCAACHGANLEGAPNWRSRGPDGRLPAPPHDETGHTWHHASDMLFGLTKYGLPALIGDPDYATDMPAYDGVLSDEEIIAVLSYIKSTWPAEVRAQHDAIDNR